MTATQTTSSVHWANAQKYSPVQPKFGLNSPEPGSLPPLTQRVSQHPDPYHPAFLDEREVLRVTYQGDDRCQLRCPGCYTGERLSRPGVKPSVQQVRIQAPFAEFKDHLQALGDGLQDFYLLGAEPTMDPEGSAVMMDWAAEQGLTVMSVTNGAVSEDRFFRTFVGAFRQQRLYKLIISLDSIDPEINNQLRGRAVAYDLTMATIQRCVRQGMPIKVQITVWPTNYHTVLATVEALWKMGVRGFAFHCGSVEGSPRHLEHGLDHLEPLAWRALCAQLHQFRAEYYDRLEHYNFPLVYATEQELRDFVIGDHALTTAYLEHVAALEAGRPSTKPFQSCPGLDVPQTYFWANAGPEGHGGVSLCNVHQEPGQDLFALYDPASRRLRVIQDPAHNQMQAMLDSPHFCPARERATGGRPSDRWATAAGDFYGICRYLGVNQAPADWLQFEKYYLDAAEFYGTAYRLSTAAGGQHQGRPYQAYLREVMSAVLPFADRTARIVQDAATLGNGSLPE